MNCFTKSFINIFNLDALDVELRWTNNKTISYRLYFVTFKAAQIAETILIPTFIREFMVKSTQQCDPEMFTVIHFYFLYFERR